ncbi:Alpha/Beta hydrolase protein [Annulohypoxylon truncatum]|uniref:Alpha/Beta hydrolase protein n=1 Tax=Annulohypoxylon truncatum TaxID=327061 RepID=UPI00200769A3|nr:Alpha/Beta hydrolase protein [Annulohypoxylon truncatum]KAI1205252.1 Alpha/Beta hydrolase protein [Annulohypoxylon truncatum]
MASQLSRLSKRTSIHSTSLAAYRLHAAALTSTSDTNTTSIKPSSGTSLPCCSLTTSTATLKSKPVGLQSVAKVSRGLTLQASKMSTMSASHGHNEACCNIPPVVSEGYVAKGSYHELGDYKTYVTGPADAEKGIIVIYDIFGYFDQTLQGADILATGKKSQRHKVFIPDWFKGKPCPIEWFPPDTEEKQKSVGGFFSDPEHAPQTVAAKLPEYFKAVQASNPSIKSWGILGYCWGGKVASLITSGDSNLFQIAAAVHPAMVDAAEAGGIKVPFILLASGEEPAETIKEFESKLKVPNHVETFADQVHGFMAARADLSNPRVKEEYTRGYQTVLDFFGKNWS